MRILLTGATGGLGRNALAFLQDAGHDVLALGRNRVVGETLNGPRTQFHALDLADVELATLTELMTGVDAIWHCAALSSPWGSRQQFERSNVMATRKLLHAGGTARVRRFIHISTPAIYFDYRHRSDVTETFHARSLANEYARTKSLAEKCVRAAAVDFPGMWTAILRPRAIFGPWDQVLVPRLDQLLTENKGRLPLPRGGRALIDMTYVENVVHAMWLATTVKGATAGQAFNITNHEPARIADVLEALFITHLHRRMKIVDVPYPALDLIARSLELASTVTRREPKITRYSAGVLAYDMTLSRALARSVLGYTPVVPLAEGIRRTASWIAAHG